MKIAFCDDEKGCIEILTAALIKYRDTFCPYMEYEAFYDAAKLLEKFKSNQDFADIVLLDIQMQNKNGIEIAKQIHEINSEIIIIFISNYDSYMQIGYEVNAFRYILKNQINTFLEKNLNSAIAEVMKQNKQKFSFKSKGEIRHIRYTDIIYFESQRRFINMISTTETNTFYGKLDEIEKQLNDARFVRCHKSYLINADYIESTTAKAVNLANKYSIPISRSKLITIKKAQVWAMR